MEPEIHPTLESVAEAVADGMPVDWEGIRAAEPEIAERLRLLRLVQELIAAHGDVRARLRDDGTPPAG